MDTVNGYSMIHWSCPECGVEHVVGENGNELYVTCKECGKQYELCFS